MEVKKNEIIQIKIPLSCANLGCGFDSFGLALNLYNVYEFQKSKKDMLLGFDDKYLNENNLCLKAYRSVFEKYKLDYIPVCIKIYDNIPKCGGLGTSANVILAGVIGAIKISKLDLNDDEIIKFACDIEGHPDNVLASFLGGLTSAIKEEDKVYHFKYEVSNDLRFSIYCPSYHASTAKMRECLPKSVSLSDAVYNISRAANLVHAFEKGLYDDIKYLVKDSLHEKYRLKYLKGADLVFEYAKKNDYAVCVSGSGSAILVITKDGSKLDDIEGYQRYDLLADNEGVKVCIK